MGNLASITEAPSNQGVLNAEMPINYLAFELPRNRFTREYESQVRTITNMYGQHNQAYSVDEWNAMLPQDILERVWGWFHGVTGFSCMFKWASGRQDAYVVLDAAEPTSEQLYQRMIALDNYKEYLT